jgi:hypothetical protein
MDDDTTGPAAPMGPAGPSAASGRAAFAPWNELQSLWASCPVSWRAGLLRELEYIMKEYQAKTMSLERCMEHIQMWMELHVK